MKTKVPCETVLQSKKLNLLVIDSTDNTGWYNSLNELGYQIEFAQNLIDASELLAKRSFAAILLNTTGLDGSGLDWARYFRSHDQAISRPIIFLSTDTVEFAEALALGGTDYMQLPARVAELNFRLQAQIRIVSEINQARRALDQLGNATVAINLKTGQIQWSTPQVQQWLGDEVPESVRVWAMKKIPLRFNFTHNQFPYSAQLKVISEDEGLISIRKEGTAIEHIMASLGLTHREAEITYWVAQGKTNPEIAIILNCATRTVHKHLENIFEKLGVSNRTSAAALAIKHFPEINRN